eukprot:4496546-Pyramimonas_sp.AAC.1
MEVWHAELQGEENCWSSEPVTVAEEQQGHLPKWGNPQDMYTIETYHVPLCSTGEDDNCGLDFDEHGQYVELCFAAEMSRIVLSEQQHQIWDFDRAITMR